MSILQLGLLCQCIALLALSLTAPASTRHRVALVFTVLALALWIAGNVHRGTL